MYIYTFRSRKDLSVTRVIVTSFPVRNVSMIEELANYPTLCPSNVINPLDCREWWLSDIACQKPE